MDVSGILAEHAAKFQSIQVDKDTPLEIDTGLLTVTDPNPIDSESYTSSLESHLTSLAREGTQALITSLFSLPTLSSADGPLAQLPPPTTQLPRAKPLPKPKLRTKWEQFAAAKGIQKKRKDKKVWDEERQEWVNSWGRDGKNKQVEEQWISEVPANADADFDPRKAARDERKARVAKNEKQRLQNLTRAASSSDPKHVRKNEIEKTLATSRTSTASLGKFDRQLEGEKKPRGVKRKFDPNEAPVSQEMKRSLALLSKIESDGKKMRKGPPPPENVVNVRKAVRNVTGGKGATSLKGKADAGKRKKR